MIATTAICVPLITPAAVAVAAPYPPTGPCSVTATARGAEAENGTTSYDVVGSGLDASQPVRVVLAATGQQVGTAETDTSGNFSTVVVASPDADASAPDLTAATPRQTCTTPPPTSAPTTPTTAPPTPRTPRPGGTTAAPASTGGNQGGPGAGSTGGGGTSATPVRSGTGSAPASTSAGSTAAPTPSATGAPATDDTPPPNGATSSSPPLAEPTPGTDTPFGIGLGIAAILLVLGTLAVLLLTRRPER